MPDKGTLEEAVGRLTTPLVHEPDPEEPDQSEPTEEAEELPLAAKADTSDEEVTEPEEAQEPSKFTVKVGGEEREVTLEELRAGYMMQSDYSKKTAELAEQRKADEQARETLREKLEQAELAARIELEDLESPSALELKETDPRAYYERKEANEIRLKRIADLKAEQNSAANKKRQARIAEEQVLLSQALPEWLDADRMNEEVALMQNTWAEAGFTAEDVADFTDHRWMLITRKAALYDRIQNAKPEDKRVTVEPKSAEPGAGSATHEDRRSKAYRDMRDKVRKTGSRQDAQRLIKALITE